VSRRIEPITAGVVAAVVGFASTFAVVLQGLRAVGADRHQAASGLTALCITMGITAIVMGVRTRIPVSIAWSTPGAALLVSAGHVDGGYRAALGAFLLTGVLIVLAGFWGGLARAIAAIPPAIAAAMLAGVLLPLCVAPVHAMDQRPWLTAPVVATWLVLLRVARPWAVPGALGVAIVAIVIDHAPHLGPTSGLLPHLSASSPTLTAGAVIGLGVPLFVVTMASQNVPGMTVLRSFGYHPRLRPLLVGTGAATAVGAPFGAHAVNLAAITAALCAGPHAGADPGRRWMASVSAGVAYLVLGLAAGVATAFVAASPVVVIEAVAGLALLGALGAALATAAADETLREPTVVTFAVSASGVAALGVSSAFWGLVAGLALAWILPRERARPAEVETAAEAAA
jgi:benzoate membrane transport protein